MGKGAGRKAEDIQTQAANRFTALGEQLNAEAKPDRAAARDYYSSIIKGGPEAFKAIAPQTEFVKKQFKAASDTLMRSLPRGGAITRAKRDLSIAQAGEIGNLFTNKIDEAVSRIAQLGVFGTQAGLDANRGSVAAGDSLANLSAQRANAVAGGVGGIAGAAGTFFGLR